jgi:hypothetical protein
MMMSISQLAELCGKTRETVKRRLESAGLVGTTGAHNSSLFESAQALAAIYESAPMPSQTALMDAKVRNLDLDSELKRQRHAIASGTLIDAKTVERVWGGMTGACRAHLLAMPYRFAIAATSANGMAAIESAARDLIYEALENIHAYNPKDYMIDPPALATEADPAIE